MENTKKGLNPLYLGVALVATLLIGAGIGFWLRPGASPPTATVEAAVTAASNAQAVARSDSTANAATKAEDAPATAATPRTGVAAPPALAPSDATPTPTIMDFLLSDARHFQGEPDAPVTMIEFSDFT